MGKLTVRKAVKRAQRRHRAAKRAARGPALRAFRVLFAGKLGRAWATRTDQVVKGRSVAAVLAPYLKVRELTGASITIEEQRDGDGGGK